MLHDPRGSYFRRQNGMSIDDMLNNSTTRPARHGQDSVVQHGCHGSQHMNGRMAQSIEDTDFNCSAIHDGPNKLVTREIPR